MMIPTLQVDAILDLLNTDDPSAGYFNQTSKDLRFRNAAMSYYKAPTRASKTKDIAPTPSINAVNARNVIDHAKIVERETFSNYLIPPLKRSFIPTTRIIAIVLKAVALFKKGMLLARVKAGKVDMSELELLNFPPVKFTTFSVDASKNNVSKEQVGL